MLRTRTHSIAPLVFLLFSTTLLGNIPAAFSADITVQVEDAAGVPVPDAVVYAEPVSGNVPFVSKPAAIEQRGKKFIPLVSVIQANSAVSFPNRDSVRHHVYSFSPAKKFELKLYSGVPSNPVIFDKAGTVVLGCNIHDFMLAFVQVVDTPYFAKSDSTGMAKLSNVPEGEYRLKTWHYALAQENVVVEQKLTVDNTDPKAKVKLELKPFPVPK